jgi:hypothetical protein
MKLAGTPGPGDHPTRVGLLLAIAMVACAALGLATDRAPAPVSSAAPTTAFSASRARAHLREITRAPHPVGSQAHAAVRQHLVESLTAVGLTPEVQHTTAMSPFAPNYAADVHNVLARLPGTNSTGAVLLLAHYDSVMGSYGASDDGAGVVAILETIRALTVGSRLRNDVIVLLSDAEEVGLLGAAAFVDEHPWFRDVAVVLNVEARGSHGASYMFQTTGPNGQLIRALGRATPRPVANTVMQEVYARLPNGTDLSVFMDTGVAGMDFAYLRGLSHYHTPLDNFETQDPASIQHHGSYLLGLARELGDIDLAAPPPSALTYFNVGPFGLARYPASWILPLAVLGFLIAVGAVLRWVARGQIAIRGVGVGLLATVATVGLAILTAQFGWGRLAASSESVRWDSYRLFYDSGPYLLAFCAVTVAIAAAGALLFGRWARAAEMAVVPVVAWSGLAVAAAIYAPGASYMFFWPGLAGVAAMALTVGPSPVDLRRAALLALLSAPVLLITAPWVRWLEIAMTMRLVAASVGLLAIILAVLTPQVVVASRALGWRASAAFLALGVLSFGWAAVTPEYDEVRKRPNQVSYAADLDTGEAYWFSGDPEVDAWTSEVLGPEPERRSLNELGLGDRPYMIRPAQAVPIASQQLVVTSDAIEGSTRLVELKLSLPVGTHRTTVELMPGTATPRVAWLNGRELAAIDGAPDTRRTLFRFVGAPLADIALRLQIAADSPLALRTVTITPGVPIDLPPRPLDTMSRSDVTVLKSIVRFE